MVSSNIIHFRQQEFKLQREEYPNVIHITPLHVIWSHYGYVKFNAILQGTTNWSMSIFGSGVITERAENYTRFPLNFL